jgi:hypothetical protein
MLRRRRHVVNGDIRLAIVFVTEIRFVSPATAFAVVVVVENIIFILILFFRFRAYIDRRRLPPRWIEVRPAAFLRLEILPPDSPPLLWAPFTAAAGGRPPLPVIVVDRYVWSLIRWGIAGIWWTSAFSATTIGRTSS